MAPRKGEDKTHRCPRCKADALVFVAEENRWRCLGPGCGWTDKPAR